MAHVQKTDFVFRREGRVHLNRRVVSVHSTTGSRGVRISCSNVGYTVFRGSVKSTGYPLHSPVSPSLPLPCVTVCHHISTGVYQEYFLGDKVGQCVGLTTLPPSCVQTVLKSGRLIHLEPTGPVQAYKGIPLPLFYHFIIRKTFPHEFDCLLEPDL